MKYESYDANQCTKKHVKKKSYNMNNLKNTKMNPVHSQLIFFFTNI